MVKQRSLLVPVLVLLSGSALAVQGPPVLGGGHTQPGGGTGSGHTGPPPHYNGPGDTAPASRGGRSESPAEPANPTPAHAAPVPPAAPTLAAPGTPTAVSLTTESDDGWWLWWEYNKMEFLRPHRLGLWGFPVTGLDPENQIQARGGVARRALEPALIQALSDPDSSVRAAATLALSRIAGADSVDPLIHMLDDRSEDVRERSILALGASGSDRAIG